MALTAPLHPNYETFIIPLELRATKIVIEADLLSLLFFQDLDQLWLMKGMWFVLGVYLGPAPWMKYRDSFQVSTRILYHPSM